MIHRLKKEKVIEMQGNRKYMSYLFRFILQFFFSMRSESSTSVLLYNKLFLIQNSQIYWKLKNCTSVSSLKCHLASSP